MRVNSRFIGRLNTGLLLSLLLPTLFGARTSQAQDYGADSANSRFSPVELTGATSFNYLALRDQPGPSGVPLGGIGVGAVDLAPDGRFTRMAIGTWMSTENGVDRARRENPEWSSEAFLALWERDARGQVSTRRLVRDQDVVFGMRGYDHTTYRGLFPTATLSFDSDRMPQPHSLVSVFAHSSLVPQNVKDSSLPAFWIDVTAANSDAKPVEVSIALSWPDIISRGLVDVADLSQMPANAIGFKSTPLISLPHVPTQADGLSMQGYVGLRQHSRPIVPNLATFQNYVNEVAILAESPADGSVSLMPSWQVRSGDAAWKSFRDTGTFDSTAAQESVLSTPDSPPSASAVAVHATIGPGEKKTFRFLVVWYMPELKQTLHPSVPHSRFGTADYGRYFQNFFPDLDSLVEYEIQNRDRLLAGTLEWQKPVLNSTLPDWLKFKLINSGYTLLTNTILNKAGEFTVMEGGMSGLAGTMDQRLSAHPVYQKFFTQLDHAELQQFADTQDEDGGILHFDGHYLVGIADANGDTPIPHSKLVDNTASWLIQVAKDYQQTGDDSFILKNREHIRRGLSYLKNQIRDDSQIPVGPQTYDDFPHPAIGSYLGTVYLATLRAGAVLGSALGDGKMVDEANRQFQLTQAGLIKTLWNGQFFAFGADLNGKNRRDDRVFTGQLAGQFISRYAGWGDVVPFNMVKSSIAEQMRTSVLNSPDLYAPKIWDLQMNRGVDMPGSRCWPFYLESYTAMAAIQAGDASDGLEIMRHIQLVNLRRGWTWTQNLWNPGELTYMTAPVTWFITDVLTGAALDVPGERLTLGLPPGTNTEPVEIPLFFPTFWAELEYEPAQNRTLLRVTKVFGTKTVTIRHLTALPPGVPSIQARTVDIPPFQMEEGRVLDLSKYQNMLRRR